MDFDQLIWVWLAFLGQRIQGLWADFDLFRHSIDIILRMFIGLDGGT